MRYFSKMRHALLFYFFANILPCLCQAQNAIDTDSLSFEQQRQRVNTLLDERSYRFGELDISFQQKTGVFGIFKTKKDMQKSIDILKQIVLTDNNIFLETKKLLDIKDNESTRNESLAKEYDAQVTAYMKTISKLQMENEKLRTQIKELDQQDHSNNLFLYLLGLIIIGLITVIFILYRKHNHKI